MIKQALLRRSLPIPQRKRPIAICRWNLKWMCSLMRSGDELCGGPGSVGWHVQSEKKESQRQPTQTRIKREEHVATWQPVLNYTSRRHDWGDFSHWKSGWIISTVHRLQKEHKTLVLLPRHTMYARTTTQFPIFYQIILIDALSPINRAVFHPIQQMSHFK